jgi:hypothetical protein
MIIELLNGIWFVFFVIAIMALTNFVNAKGYFIPFYNFLKRKIRSKRLLVALVSAVSGVLPIPGRTIVSAGALDTLAPEDNRRKNFGLINYLSTHHYYLWSPLEATVLIPLSVLGLTYFEFISIIAPLLLTLLLITLYYIFFVLKESDVIINKVQHKKQDFNLLKSIKWDVPLFVGIVIIIGNLFKFYSEDITEFFMNYSSSIFFASVIAFVTSFILGSSSKFAGITTLLVSIFGLNYLPLLFSLGYAGYLISPTHKCLVITKTYFGLDMSFYRALLLISTVLVTVGYLLV